MRRSKSTSVLYAGRKLRGLSHWTEVDLVFACGPKMSCLCGDQKRMLVLVEVDLFFVSGPEIILLSCERRNLLGVCVDGQTLS